MRRWMKKDEMVETHKGGKNWNKKDKDSFIWFFAFVLSILCFRLLIFYFCFFNILNLTIENFQKKFNQF